MDLPWILLFISILLIALIAWHSSRISLTQFFKQRRARKKTSSIEPDYQEAVQDDLFAQPDPLESREDKPLTVPNTQQPIFCIHLKGPEGRVFGGEQLVIQLNRAGLRFGAFNIFHYQNLFSLASAYEPGTFDLERLDSLRTKGLTFFMDTAQVVNVREAFETMLDTAQHLAEQLRAELFDDQWQPLNENTLERYFDLVCHCEGTPEAIQDFR